MVKWKKGLWYIVLNNIKIQMKLNIFDSLLKSSINRNE